MSTLLEKIIDQYLTSRDFNGLYIHRESDDVIARAVQLIDDGLVQAVDSGDWMNPHIRPWPSRRTIAQQVDSVRSIGSADYGLCLYPTSVALESIDFGSRFAGRPYHLDMASGKGTLELAYFKFEVLEPYRNDPRFEFKFGDYGVDIGISNDVYVDESEPDDDKTSISHVGFAYDLSGYRKDDPESAVVRRVCAFYCDLKGLNETHQQRWKTYEVGSIGLQPHPLWWGQQMGHWPDALGPFSKLFLELKMWNELHERAFGSSLLNTVARPDDFGWILRASRQEYEIFVHNLDKLLSENIRHKALDDLRARKIGDDSGQLGTINRLDDVLAQRQIPEDARKEVLGPLREVRKARQSPAHRIRNNVTDSTYIHKQAALLDQVTESIETLRRLWQKHPVNADWTEPELARSDRRHYRL